MEQALLFREQMLGVLGHDLRNPVTAVKGLAGLLLMHDPPEPMRAGLQRIDQAAGRMNEMIGTLLDFTHSRFRGRLPISPEEDTDLLLISRRVVDELSVAHPQRDLRVHGEGNVCGFWDPARLGQVVSNLVGNALVHGAWDGPIEVALRDDGDHVLCDVSNAGGAIPEAQVARLFEPFQQGTGDGTTRGLGLGLYIVRQIVDAHGGTITVRSSEGRTSFRVRLARTTA
jgi:signal transduction histidine kinase